VLAAVILAAALGDAEPAPQPQGVLERVVAQFRSHRPPPPYESYTLVRMQQTTNGAPDIPNNYAKRVWFRGADRAALTRLVFKDGSLGPLTFDRPAFNEARDPGPPTVDLFEPARVTNRAEAAAAAPDYAVDSLETLGPVLHLVIHPVRDAGRNRLREIFCDSTTYELRKLVATDALYITRGPTYPIVLTITMGVVGGIPVVTELHGVVGGGFNGDGQEVDYQFRDITFPAALPDWFFDPRTYRAHANDPT
jgi:hypothetical protein